GELGSRVCGATSPRRAAVPERPTPRMITGGAIAASLELSTNWLRADVRRPLAVDLRGSDPAGLDAEEPGDVVGAVDALGAVVLAELARDLVALHQQTLQRQPRRERLERTGKERSESRGSLEAGGAGDTTHGRAEASHERI